MVVQELITNISERLSKTSRVDAVFGEPRTIGRKTIIPVAWVGVGFGAGGGEGKQEKDGENPTQQGSGGGGGGGGAARPLAVLEVTDEETRIIPIIDTTRVVLAGLALAGAIVITIGRIVGRCRK